jgi:hypothetical protein
MPSLINTTEIDTEFPVPGQDNDSQGFRDNFTNIKTNLDTAKTEIETLQSDTVKVNADTTFLTTNTGAASQLIRANLKSFSTAKYPAEPELESIASTILELNFNNGDYQVCRFTQPSIEINFDQTGWPAAGRVGKITLELTSTSNSGETPGTLLTFDNNLDIVFGGAWDSDEGIRSIQIGTNPTIVELWTRQGGTTIFARNLGEFN